MRRWVFALLLLVVPFQLVWGAAAPYCAHEAIAAAKKHFGHHEHTHENGGQIDPATDAGDIESAFHADCESCHLCCSAFVPAAVPPVEGLPHGDAVRRPEPRYNSHIPASLLRPDRAQTTPAARLGGDVVLVSLAN